MEPLYNSAKTTFLKALVDKLKKLEYADNVIRDVEKTTKDIISSVGSECAKGMKTIQGALFSVMIHITVEVIRRLETLPFFTTLDECLQGMLCESVTWAAGYVIGITFV